MRFPLLLTMAVAVFCGGGIQGSDKIMYPAARRSQQTDLLHGVQVEDPYRWLEDTDSPETKAWIGAENTLTEGYLGQIPARQLIERRLTELWHFERYAASGPGRNAGFFKAGNRYFYLRNDGLQNQFALLPCHPQGRPVLWIEYAIERWYRCASRPGTLRQPRWEDASLRDFTLGLGLAGVAGARY